MPALLQAAVAIANGHLPVLRRDVMKDAGRDHQIEFCLRPEFIHGHKAASWVVPACDRKTFSRRIATDDLGFRKDLAQVRHATTNSAAKIEDRTDGASQSLRQFDFVASKIAAVAVEEIRLLGEDRLVLPGVLIEIDPRHETPSHMDRRHRYANKNNKQLR
ncbi:MAG: hypothetical protein WA732_11070 [Pseudolabrys sp.]